MNNLAEQFLPAHPILDAALVSGNGQYHTDKSKPYIFTSLANIYDMVADPSAVPKEAAQWFIPSSLASRVHAEQRESGRFYALWADFDEPTTTISETHGICLDAVGADCLTYASRSATPDKQKARLIVPLSTPCDGATFVMLQTILNQRLAKGGLIPDTASQRVGQLCYLPNRGDFYAYEISDDGGPLDWKVSFASDIKAARIEQQAQEAVQATQMAQARVRATQRLASGQTSPIDAFNHGYDVALLLKQYGYLQKGNRFLSPNSSSKTPGVVIKGNRWLSSHESDAGIGKECNGGTSGDAFDLFIHYECGGDRNAALQAAGAMFVNPDGITITQANQRNHMQANNSVTFDAGDAFSDYQDIPSQTVTPAKSRFDLANRTAANLFKGPPPEQDWVVEGIFPAGKLAVLASPPGVGKSFLALDLARKAAGRYNAEHPSVAFGAVVRGFGRTIYISAEDDNEEIHRRLHSLIDAGPMPDRLHVLSLPDVGHFGVIEVNPITKAMRPTAAWIDLSREIQNLPDVKLVVLDTLQALSTGDTNDAAAVQPLMNQCTELAAATGATVLLIHHVGKGSTKDIKTALDAAEAIRGSGAITGSARAAYVLWPASLTEGRKVCETLDVKYEENAVVIGMVAKANGASRRDRTYFLRDASGLLRDVTQRYYAAGGDDTLAMQVQLIDAISKAWTEGNAFAASYGANGLHSRRFELPESFHEKPRQWFEEQVGLLISEKKLKRMQQKRGFRLALFDADDCNDEVDQ